MWRDFFVNTDSKSLYHLFFYTLQGAKPFMYGSCDCDSLVNTDSKSLFHLTFDTLQGAVDMVPNPLSTAPGTLLEHLKA